MTVAVLSIASALIPATAMLVVLLPGFLIGQSPALLAPMILGQIVRPAFVAPGIEHAGALHSRSAWRTLDRLSS